jgi:hypothetical protein
LLQAEPTTEVAEILGADLNRSESSWLLLARERPEVRIRSHSALGGDVDSMSG